MIAMKPTFLVTYNKQFVPERSIDQELGKPHGIANASQS
jgi:hypothetical protein